MSTKQTPLGRLLQTSREVAGYSRPTLATRTGVPAPTIESWEMTSAGKGPGLVAMLKLRRALGIPFEDLERAALELPGTATDRDTPTQASVRTARRVLGVTIGDLAQMLDSTAGDVAAFEEGTLDASPEVMAALVAIVSAELARRD